MSKTILLQHTCNITPQSETTVSDSCQSVGKRVFTNMNRANTFKAQGGRKLSGTKETFGDQGRSLWVIWAVGSGVLGSLVLGVMGYWVLGSLGPCTMGPWVLGSVGPWGFANRSDAWNKPIQCTSAPLNCMGTPIRCMGIPLRCMGAPLSCCMSATLHCMGSPAHRSATWAHSSAACSKPLRCIEKTDPMHGK